MITAAGNSRIKNLVKLNQKAKERKEQNVFVVEGIKMFLEAPIERIREVYISESLFLKGSCAQKLEQCKVEVVSDDVFLKITDTVTPQGVLCVIEQFHYSLPSLLTKENPLLLILEDIQDPGNLGTILRTAEGAGVDGVIMSRETVDLYNPKTIRATMGSIYRVPFIYTDCIQELISNLRAHGVLTYAAQLQESSDYDKLDYKKGTAFLIGNEGNGLKSETVQAADAYLRVPMAGKVESLNAAVAASILIYEAARQRKFQTKN